MCVCVCVCVCVSRVCTLVTHVHRLCAVATTAHALGLVLRIFRNICLRIFRSICCAPDSTVHVVLDFRPDIVSFHRFGIKTIRSAGRQHLF